MTDDARESRDRQRPRTAGDGGAKGRLEFTNDLDDTRVFVQLLGTLVHRLDMDRRKLFGNDLEMACVAGAVALEATEANLRLADFRDKYRDLRTVIGLEGQRGVNALSIAQYTGIPRETVRRKLKRLVELGVIAEKTRGSYVIKPGFPQRPENLAAIQNMMRYVLQFMNDCLTLGLVRGGER